MPRGQAALRGAQEVGFTIVSITLSLLAVFLPILLMGGIVGRLFREFAVTLSMAILVSMVISLTTTPMLCALFLRPATTKADSLRRRKSFGQRAQDFYGRTLTWALNHNGLVFTILLATVVMNVVLIVIIPKGFFPTQDTGRLIGSLQADQSISFQAMSKKLTQMMAIVQQDPAVINVVGATGSGSGGAASQTNTGSVYVAFEAEERARHPGHGHRTAPARALPCAGRAVVLGAGAGYPRRWTTEQRRLSIHPTRRQHGRGVRVDTEAVASSPE